MEFFLNPHKAPPKFAKKSGHSHRHRLLSLIFHRLLRRKLSVSILTFNFAGIPLVTKHFLERLHALPDEILKVGADIVCFQEIWLDQNKRFIIESLQERGYSYSYQGRSAPRLCGLLILSRFPIENEESVSLRPFFEGINLSLIESPGDKGYILVKVKVSGKQSFWLFNSHLSAHFGSEFKPQSKIYQAKLKELEKFSQKIRIMGKERIVVAGDLNLHPGTDPYHQFLKDSGLWDTEPKNQPSQTVLKNIFKFPLPEVGRKVDYILTKNFPRKSLVQYRILWQKPISRLGGYLSDHAGILVKLRI